MKRWKSGRLDSYLVSSWALKVLQPDVNIRPQALQLEQHEQPWPPPHPHLHALDGELPSQVVAVGGAAGKPDPKPVHRARARPVHGLHHRAKDARVLHNLVRALLSRCVVVLQHLLHLDQKMIGANLGSFLLFSTNNENSSKRRNPKINPTWSWAIPPPLSEIRTMKS